MCLSEGWRKSAPAIVFIAVGMGKVAELEQVSIIIVVISLDKRCSPSFYIEIGYESNMESSNEADSLPLFLILGHTVQATLPWSHPLCFTAGSHETRHIQRDQMSKQNTIIHL